MTEQATSSTSNSALQALVREQADEINRLREQLDLAGTMSPRARLLNDVQQDEEKIRNSLEMQLGQARQAKAALEASMEERAKTFQKSLEKLHASPSTASNATAGSTTPITTEAAAVTSDDPEVVRVELQKALHRIAEQEIQLKKLKFDLEMEQGHVNILRHDSQMLRQMTVDMTALAEQEEEYISNKLLKRISGLKKEKGELLLQVEQEEEYLTNTLQKKLSQLQKEKIDMENALEQEQEYIVNRLQKQLDQLRVQQSGGQVAPGGLGLSRSNSLSSGREGEQGTGVNNAGAGVPVSPVIGSGVHKKWVPSHSPSSSDFGITSQGVVEVLRAEINALKNRMTEMEKEYLNKISQTNKLKTELAEYRKRAGLSIEDLNVDESIPSFMRSVPSSPGGRTIRNRDSRSASVSSQRSLSDKAPQPGPSNSSSVNLGIHIPGSSGSQPPPTQSMPIPSPSRSSGHTSDNFSGSASNSYGGTGYAYGPYGNNPSASVSSSSTASVTSVSSLSGVAGGAPQPAQSRSRSVSNSGNVSSNSRRDMPTRRISGGPFNVPFQPPQHPPHP